MYVYTVVGMAKRETEGFWSSNKLGEGVGHSSLRHPVRIGPHIVACLSLSSGSTFDDIFLVDVYSGSQK